MSKLCQQFPASVTYLKMLPDQLFLSRGKLAIEVGKEVPAHKPATFLFIFVLHIQRIDGSTVFANSAGHAG
jgi:hypothetical protein